MAAAAAAGFSSGCNFLPFIWPIKYKERMALGLDKLFLHLGMRSHGYQAANQCKCLHPLAVERVQPLRGCIVCVYVTASFYLSVFLALFSFLLISLYPSLTHIILYPTYISTCMCLKTHACKHVHTRTRAHIHTNTHSRLQHLDSITICLISHAVR